MNNIIYLNVAGFYIRIKFKKSSYPPDKNKFKNHIQTNYYSFIVKKIPRTIDYTLQFEETAKMIDTIKRGNSVFIIFYKEINNSTIQTHYQISQMQLHLILRFIINKLLVDKGFLLHASAVKINKKADIFLGKSGFGKSTIIAMLQNIYAPLADDLIIIKKENDDYLFFQTPFFEKNFHLLKKSGYNSYPIGRIFFIKKAKHNQIVKILDKSIILNKFITQSYIEEKDIKKQTTQAINFIKKMDNFYFLFFKKNKNQLVKMFNK